MALTLQNKKSVKTIKPGKRIGRGLGSGKGAYSTKGVKGQKARTGGRNGLIRLGMRRNVASIPQLPGFRSLYPKMAIINLSTIDKSFNDGEKVTIATLNAKGLLAKTSEKLKILGNGPLTKKVVIVAHAASSSAIDAISKAGGTLSLIGSRSKSKKEVK